MPQPKSPPLLGWVTNGLTRCPFMEINIETFSTPLNYKREMILSYRVWNSDFHTTTKRQTCYSRFVIPISTIPITKHSFFLIFSETFSLLPNALLCSLLPNFLLFLSPICPHEAVDLSPSKVFPLLKFEIWKSWGLKVLIWNLIWV